MTYDMSSDMSSDIDRAVERARDRALDEHLEPRFDPDAADTRLVELVDAIAEIISDIEDARVAGAEELARAADLVEAARKSMLYSCEEPEEPEE